MDELREPESAAHSSEGETFEWTVRLWKENPKRLGAIALTALIAGIFGFWALRHPVGFLVGVAMIGLSSADFWMPIHFQLTPQEAKRRVGPSLSSIAWADVQQVREDELGAKLSPLRDPSSRLESFRGIYLRYDGNRQAVIDRIRSQVGESCKISGPKN